MKPNYKTLGIISFIVSFLSPFMAMALIDKIGEVEIFSTDGMMRYSWIFWLFIPVVLTSYLFGRKLKEAGLNPGVDDPLANINIRTDIAFAAQAGAFISGEGDYTTLFEPTASELELSKKGYVVASVGEYTENVAYTTYQALKSYIDENDETIVNFTKAIAESLVWVKNHTSNEIALSIKDFFKETDIKILTNSIERYREINAWSNTPYLDEEEFKHLQDIIISAKELDKYMPYNVLVNNKHYDKK